MFLEKWIPEALQTSATFLDRIYGGGGGTAFTVNNCVLRGFLDELNLRLIASGCTAYVVEGDRRLCMT